jgi:hypothetical protein
MKKQSRVERGALLSKSQLKKKVAQIVLAQGNIFIKDLLRSNKVSIGNTKADFAENLAAAIDAGVLTQEVIEAWLGESGLGQPTCVSLRAAYDLTDKGASHSRSVQIR